MVCNGINPDAENHINVRHIYDLIPSVALCVKLCAPLYFK